MHALLRLDDLMHPLKNVSTRAGEILQGFFAKMSCFWPHWMMSWMDLASCSCKGIRGMFCRGWDDVSDHRSCRARILLVLANTAITMNAPVMTFYKKGDIPNRKIMSAQFKQLSNFKTLLVSLNSQQNPCISVYRELEIQARYPLSGLRGSQILLQSEALCHYAEPKSSRF